MSSKRRDEIVAQSAQLFRTYGYNGASMRTVAEGIKTTEAAVELARRQAVEMPISVQMLEMLNFGLPPREAVRRLMERTLKEE